MNFFTFDIRKVILVIAAVVIPLLAINMQRKSEEELWFVRPFSFFAGLAQSAYTNFSSGVRGTTSLYLDLIDIKKENLRLEQENAELTAQLGAMTELKLENERLNALIGFKQNTKMELLTARVIGGDALPDHDSLSINRGSVHGVRKHMAAITAGGVVGYVFRVEPYSAQILVMTDRYSAIDSIVQRSRARGITEGVGREFCRLKYLRRGDDVEVGDLVVTSGLHNIFPKGFPIGTVTSVTKSDYGMSQEVEIRPLINASHLEELFIVLNANQEDFSPQNNDNEVEDALGSTKSNSLIENQETTL